MNLCLFMCTLMGKRLALFFFYNFLLLQSFWGLKIEFLRNKMFLRVVCL